MAKPLPSPEQVKEVADRVFDLMYEGRSLTKACELCEISRRTFERWIQESPQLMSEYARARNALIDYYAESLEDVGQEALMSDNMVKIAAYRILSDNRKWTASKLAPKKYGDKFELSGSSDAPLQIVSRIEIVALK